MIFFLTEAIITTNSIRMNQVSQDSIEKPEEPARSRHCVRERICRKRHWGNLGRRRGAMNWSQENCLIDGHRLTCERREGDLRLVPDDPHLCGVVSAAILCAVTLRAPRQGKDILQSLLSLTERGCFYLRTFRTQNCPLPAGLGRMLCKSTASMSVAGNAFSKRGLRRRTHIFDGVKT